MQTPVFRSQIELEKYMDISVMSGEGLFNHNPSLLVLQQYYKWLISRSNNMKKLICEFNKRTLVLKDKEYQIEPEIAKWLIHNTDVKVAYKFGE
jgi:hypothetical protein